MPTIDEIKEKTNDIFKMYPIKKVTVFGSYAKGTQTPESDIDFLIRDSHISVLTVANIREQLATTLDKNIDLISEEDISDFLSLLTQL